MSNKRHIEPLLWSLFGAGGTTIAFVFPAIIFVVSLGIPLGIVPVQALSYQRMSSFFFQGWFGRLVLVATLIPAYWACIHRIYHGLHDLGWHAGRGVKITCYGGALLLSTITVILLL